MAREAKDIQIEGCFVAPGDGAGWVRTGEDTAVPSRISAQLHLLDPSVVVSMLVLVSAGGRANVAELHVAPREMSTSVTTTTLRKIPVDHLLRVALDSATVRGRNRPDLHPDAFQMPGDPEDQAWVSPRPTTGRGSETPKDRVAQAAQIYLRALAGGSRKPAEVVAEQLHYSRATAARDIREARSRGLLPPVGDQEAAKVTAPSSEAVAPDPVWPRFDDPTKWASRSDVLDGPSGLPVYDPSASDSPANPTPMPRDPSAPDTWIERIRDAAAQAAEKEESADDAGAQDS